MKRREKIKNPGEKKEREEYSKIFTGGRTESKRSAIVRKKNWAFRYVRGTAL
jgi:hypothetical protein